MIDNKQITDELRKWMNDNYPAWRKLRTGVSGQLDRIDTEHEAMLVDARKTVYQGYIELPKDADGEYIHVGDVMKSEKIGGGFCEPFEVVGYIMSNGELEPMDEHKCPRKRKYLHHHKQPTVEDVLREFADAMSENLGMYTGEVIDADEWRDADRKTIAEYAAKLRLAGGDAE